MLDLIGGVGVESTKVDGGRIDGHGGGEGKGNGRSGRMGRLWGTERRIKRDRTGKHLWKDRDEDI